MRRPDRFRQQDRARGPLAAETEAVAGPQHKQLRVRLRQSPEEREHGKPEDRPLEYAHPPEPVRQGPRDPASDGRGNKRDAAKESGLRPAQREGPGQGRQGDPEHL